MFFYFDPLTSAQSSGRKFKKSLQKSICIARPKRG